MTGVADDIGEDNRPTLKRETASVCAWRGRVLSLYQTAGLLILTDYRPKRTRNKLGQCRKRGQCYQ